MHADVRIGVHPPSAAVSKRLRLFHFSFLNHASRTKFDQFVGLTTK